MTGALVLAAGASSRLGQPKQLLEVEGEALVRRAARVALEAGCSPVVVVEGAVPLAQALAGLEVTLVRCAEWALGPGASLSRGLVALQGRADGAVVLLVDQHRVTRADVAELVRAPGSVAAAFYAGTLGVPARFGAEHFDALRALPPGQGAKPWLAAHRELVTAVPMPHAEVDLDVPADVAGLGQDSPRRGSA